MTVATFFAHSFLLVLLAAVSPVLFLNASRVVESAGSRAGIYFASGAAFCLFSLGVPAMGLMGAATSQEIAAGLASRRVDLVLALVLIAYGGWQLFQIRRTPASPPTGAGDHHDAALPKDGRGLFAAGLLGMITNFTTLPLFLSVAQRIGAVSISWAGRGLLLIMVVLVVLTPTWLPIIMHALTPATSGLSPQLRRRIQRATQQISIGACLLGGVVIIWHVVAGR